MDTLAYMTDTAEVSEEASSNIETSAPTKRQFFADIAKYAKMEGQGDNARPAMYLRTARAAQDKVIGQGDAKANQAEVEDIFNRYTRDVAAAQKIGWKPQASAKQQISKLMNAVKLGNLPHVNAGVLLNRVVELQEEQKASEGKLHFSSFDGLVKVSREQVKAPDMQLGDDVIRGLLLPNGNADEKTEADRIEAIVKQIEKLMDAKEEPVSAETAEALAEAAGPLMTRIKDLGGSTAMRRQADKAEAAAEKARAQHATLVDHAVWYRGRLEPVAG